MKEKILVIDDDETLLKTLDKLLNKEGYQVSIANSSLDGIDKVREGFFDIIILDIRMPDMDGITLLKEIRELQKGMLESIVIIVTGYASEDVPIKAIKLKVDDYIMKPFELDEFLHSVERNIEICRLRNEKKKYLSELEEKNRELERSRGKYKNLVNSLIRVAWLRAGSKDVEREVKRILKTIK